MSLIGAILRLCIRMYQLVISPWLVPSCRFHPSCSQYAIDSLEKHNLINAIALIFWRLLRCHPFGGHGYDPAPEEPLINLKSKKFRNMERNKTSCS